MSDRSEALAARLEAGATKLAEFAATLSETEWQTPVPHDGRKIGVVLHHVASVYAIEINLAQSLAAGQPITAVTWDAVHAMNRDHAKQNDGVTKEAALALLGANSATAAAAIRALGWDGRCGWSRCTGWGSLRPDWSSVSPSPGIFAMSPPAGCPDLSTGHSSPSAN